MLQQLVLFIHLILAFTLIALVLLQHGKGADAGAAFGSGASGTVFGSAGSATFLTKLTTVIALFFAITCISLTVIASRKSSELTSLSDEYMAVDKAGPAPAPVPASETTPPPVVPE